MDLSFFFLFYFLFFFMLHHFSSICETPEFLRIKFNQEKPTSCDETKSSTARIENN